MKLETIEEEEVDCELLEAEILFTAVENTLP